MERQAIARRSIRGSLVLFAGYFTQTVVNAATIIIIARLLGPTGYGIYTLALVLPTLIQLFVGFGVNAAVIRYTAYYHSRGNSEEARRFTASAILFLLISGAAFTLVSVALAGFESAWVLGRPELAPLVQFTSLAILGQTMVQAVSASAIGWGRMGVSSLTQVSLVLVKLIVSPLLVLAGFGVLGALYGQVAAYFAGAAAAGSLLYAWELRGEALLKGFGRNVKIMLTYGIPVFLGTATSGLGTYYVAILVAAVASTTVFGFYQAAFNFTSIVTLVSSSMVNALFPAFSAVDGVGGDIRSAFRRAYKLFAVGMAPLVVFLAVASEPLVRMLLGSSYIPSAPLLALMGLATLPVAFGYTVHPAFFNGFGKTRYTFFTYLTGAVALIASAPFLAVYLGEGVDGLIFATFISYIVSWATGAALALRGFRASLDMRGNGLVLVACALSSGPPLALGRLSLVPPLALLLDFVLFFGVYVTAAPLIGAVTATELGTIQDSMTGLGYLERLVGPFFRYEMFMLSISARVGPRGREG